MQKIDSLIHKKLSEIINRDYFEKLGFVSVNFVSTSKDLNQTKVFVSFNNEKNNRSFNKLEKLRGQIQKTFGRSIKLRKTPRIEFILDRDKDEIDNIEKILEKISKKNEN